MTDRKLIYEAYDPDLAEEIQWFWLHRLVRVEVDLDQDKLRFYRLRRREPMEQPLVGELSHRIKGGRFYE